MTDTLRQVDLRLVDSFDEAEALMRWLGERRPVLGFDTETGGLEWWRVRLRIVQVGDAHTGWSIPWDEWRGLAREVFKRYDRPMVAHNATFDAHMLETNGIELKRELVHDSAVMAHIVDPLRGKKLKVLTQRLLDPTAALGQEVLELAMLKNGWTWDTVPIDYAGYWGYASLDPVLTCRLFEEFEPEVSRDFADVYALERAVQWVLADMERVGIRLDLDYCAQQYERLSAYADEATAYCVSRWGITPSSSRMANKLQSLGARLTAKTDKGAFKADKDVLLGLIPYGGEPAELASVVMDAKRADHFAKSYFRRMLELVDGDMLHANIDGLGARTARMSVSKPPLQQMPSDSPIVRDAFLVNAAADFDQIEVRLLAHFANEQGMLDAIEQGVDLHMHAARLMYGPNAGKPERKKSKSGTFGKIYGVGKAKFAAQQGVTLSAANEFLALYDRTFPRVKAFIDDVKRTGAQRRTSDGRGWVRTPAGRRQLLPEGDTAFYVLVNYLIQGTAADVMKQQLVSLAAAGFGEYMRLPVHDEVLFDFPEDSKEELLAAAVDAMAVPDTFRCPLSVEGKTFERWGDPYRDAA